MDGSWDSRQQLDATLMSVAGRLATCSAKVEQVLGGFHDIQLLDWQSPAGRAYRDAVTLQASSLRRALDRLQEARLAVARRAQDDTGVPIATSGWPR